MKKLLATVALTVVAFGGIATSAQAGGRPTRPSTNCTNAAARMQQLAKEGRTISAQLQEVRAQQAANTTPNFGVVDQSLADQLFVRETALTNAGNANSQAKGDLSRACNIPFLI